MTMLTTTAEVSALCERLAKAEYVTVDTEFMRETTYWAKLCLVQIAGPDESAAIDPLAPGMDLTPLFTLLANPDILKVFHAARQDLEIFHHLSGDVPHPIFDSQVAAMVCGFGDSVAYDTLAARLAGANIDKHSRFTDWARRPLTDRQVGYALDDVIHLRPIYEKLSGMLEKNGRKHWLGEEMAILTDRGTYEVNPRETWRRLKLRNPKPRMVAVLQEIAAWREVEAQLRDVPRNRIIRDEALLEIAAHPPKSREELGGIRGFPKGIAEGARGEAIVEAVGRALALSKNELPDVPDRSQKAQGIGPLVELLKVLLRMKCEEHEVAQKLIANVSDLEQIATDDKAQVAALQGWRRDVFGTDALRLKHGELALAATGRKVNLIEVTTR
ncbi:MAG: ribonuclease D [Proteobacteria bacterium]|nr:ribonuclease D [Pseudomonadota bacterium]